MRLKLQNIGIIEEADINVDGITLIAGQNDSGKSTIGKVLYALIRGVNIDEERFNSSRNEFVRNRIRDIRNLLIRAKSTIPEDKEIRKKFISSFLETDESIFDSFAFEIDTENPKEIEGLRFELEKIISLYKSFSNEALQYQLELIINDIIKRISINVNSNEVLHYELESFFKNEFGNQIVNEFKKSSSFIETHEIEERKITFNHHSLAFKGFDSTSIYNYEDVYFIESPIGINDRNIFRFNNGVLRNRNEYLNHKIFQPKREQDIFSDTSETLLRFKKIITDVIKGEFIINPRGVLVFKKNKVEFNLDNVATGIKTFGIIQMLLENDSLNSNSLLIVDEPEVHLHPTWQVKYAEILVRLSKEFAIPIVLTSHSPYFIEALEAYTKKYKYEDSTNFYFAEKNEDGLSSKIIDVTKNISPILSSISEAFYEIQDINDED
jgi:predicted ATPase